MSSRAAFPFSAVVGQDDARLALLLAAVDPGIGGVLLRGDKGSAKSTLARGLAALLPDGSPFVELPVGATEDRVVGGLDVGAALGAAAEVRLRPGLLAAAHGGVLYVDEVNLLPDHLVDVLLDAAASGVHRVERDGLSHEHLARFVLVGSMNPEEGELRPQLLDRFGLAVDVRAPADASQRAEVVRRRLAFERGEPVDHHDGVLRERLAAAWPAAVPDDVIDFACRLALGVGAEGLRADLVLVRAAAALAGWEHRATTAADVERVAPLALVHRRRRRPFDPPSLPPEELAAALAQAQSPGRSETVDGSWGETAPESLLAEPPPASVAAPRPRRPATGPEVRGVLVGDRVPGPNGPSGVAVAATVRSAIARGGAAVSAEDVREPVRRRDATQAVILTVDTSGSMGSRTRVEAAAGAVLALLADAYRSRHRVGLVTFRGTSAEVVLAPTASVEIARARLGALPTGGATPLAEGIEAALDVARRVARNGDDPLVVLLTDGRATAGEAAVDRAVDAAGAVAAAGVRAVVLDGEDGSGARLGLASRIAAAMGAACIPLHEVTAGAVEGAVRAGMVAG